MPKYDVTIKAGEKDLHKIPQVVESLRFLNPQPEGIYIITKVGIVPPSLVNDVRIHGIKDIDVFPYCDRDNIAYRKNWCFSQFIAVFEDLTPNDYHLDVNADNFFVNPVELFTPDGKPIFFVSPQHDHYHQPYFDFSRKMFNVERVGSDCFIVDFMMYDKRIAKRMLDSTGSFDNFFLAACKIINSSCYPAEQEFYANWCLKNHPKAYVVKRDVFTLIVGKVAPATYSEQEIAEIVNKKVLAVSCHTWENPKKIKLVNDTINRDDINALCGWLQQTPTPNLTKGELTVELEQKWTYRIGTKHSVFVNSGSSAILLLLAAYRIEFSYNPTIVIPAVSWATDVSTPMLLGYEIILCDCNMSDLSCDLIELEAIFRRDAPAFFLSISVLGLIPDMDKIVKLCKEYNVTLIEDNCESLHSLIGNKMLGVFGHASVFSTYYGHHLSTIEGGFICTDDSELYDILISMRSHGWSRDWSIVAQKRMANQFDISPFDSQYAFYYPGFNLRSTDLQAFIGLRMIDRMTEYATKRYNNFLLYLTSIKKNLLNLTPRENEFISNFGYPVVSERRSLIVADLQTHGIEVRPIIAGSIGKQPFWIRRYEEQSLTNADIVHKYGFYVPNHQDLTPEEITFIVNIINKYA